MTRPNVLIDDPRDFPIEVVYEMVDELQARIAEAVSSDGEAEANLCKFFSITPVAAKMLCALSDGRPRSREALATVCTMKGTDELVVKAKSGPAVVDVHICHIRRSLDRYGVTITTLWGFGYQAPPETRTFLKAVMRGETPTKDTSHED